MATLEFVRLLPENAEKYADDVRRLYGDLTDYVLTDEDFRKGYAEVIAPLPNRAFVIALRNGEAVGMGAITYRPTLHERILWMDDFVVAKKWRHKERIATKLWYALIHTMDAFPWTDLEGSVGRHESRDDARKFLVQKGMHRRSTDVYSARRSTVLKEEQSPGAPRRQGD